MKTGHHILPIVVEEQDEDDIMHQQRDETNEAL